MSVQAIGWVLDHAPTSEGKGGITDRLVLISLANHAGQSPISDAWESWPSVEQIAHEAGLARARTVQDSLARLERQGLVVRVLNGAVESNAAVNRRPNLYRLPLEVGRRCRRGCRWCEPVGVTRNDTDGVTRDAARGDASRRAGVTRNDAKRELALLSLEPSLEPSSEPRVDILFDAFWTVYPKRQAKRAAQLAWSKAIARAEPVEIVDGAKRYALDPNRDPAFTMNPATWLNGDCWLDEALPPRRTSAKTAISRDIAHDRSIPSGRLQ